MKVGIAGAGTIIPAFLKAQTHIDELKMEAICAVADQQEKLEAFAQQYDIPHIYNDYGKMLEECDLDVAYVAVPNHLHFMFSKMALQKGCSVICEKPFCSNSEEAEELVNLAREKGLFLFEAISNQYFPNYEKVKELLPQLGDIKIIEMNYSQYSRRYDEFKAGNVLPVFDPKKSGGALMDLNVYNIHFILGLFGEPESVHYFANIEKGIDTSGTLVLKYPTFTCTSIGAKDCKAPVCINIQGDKAYIHSDSPANVFQGFTFSTNSGEKEDFALNTVEDRLYYEQKAFTDMVLAKDYALNDKRMNASLAVQKILDEARTQVGVPVCSSVK